MHLADSFLAQPDVAANSCNNLSYLVIRKNVVQRISQLKKGQTCLGVVKSNNESVYQNIKKVAKSLSTKNKSYC